MKKALMIVGLLGILSMCVESPKPVPPVKLVGINGEALYVIVNGKVIMMSKPSLNNREIFTIHLNRDTLFKGDTLVASFKIMGEYSKVDIDSPLSQTVPVDNFKSGLADFKFKTNQIGIQTFSGTIHSDTVSKPFKLKFLVTQ